MQLRHVLILNELEAAAVLDACISYKLSILLVGKETVDCGTLHPQIHASAVSMSRTCIAVPHSGYLDACQQLRSLRILFGK